MLGFLITTTLLTASFAPAGEDAAGGAATVAADITSSDSGGGGGDVNAAPTRSFWRRFQIHGALGQGFIYGSGNNYLTMNSNDGSARWSDATINVSTAITDNFHAGVQLHSYILGQIGRANVQIDWAYGDYKVKPWLGLRGGKLKAPMGLFNEIADTDTLYNWALLLQGMYEAEFRSYNIPITGGELYGTVKLPIGGKVTYQIFGGQRTVTSNDGSALLTWQLYGIALPTGSGYSYGGDIKWKTAIRGLVAGVSFDNSRQYVPNGLWAAAFNPYGVPIVLRIDSAISREIYSIEYQRGKLDLAAEGKHEPHWVRTTALPPASGRRRGTPGT